MNEQIKYDVIKRLVENDGNKKDQFHNYNI